MMTPLEPLLQKIIDGQRPSRNDIILLLRSKNLFDLGHAATELTRQKNPDRPGIISYIVDRNINYTNVCISKCRFCAFYQDAESKDAYILTKEEILEKVREAVELGGVQILLQGGLHPDLRIDYYEDLLKGIKEKFPLIHLHAFSPPEILHISELSGLEVGKTISILKDAGLGSIPGGGAELLSDTVREVISPAKCNTAQWLGVMETAHNLGLRTSATMMFGHMETEEDIADHLLAVRDLQDRTSGFTAFIPWTFQSKNTQLGKGTAVVGGFGYLRMVAVSRIVLDNFRHIQASWVTQGPKVAQMALFFGADDMGSTMIEENVVRAAGACFRLSSHEIHRLIEEIGMKPMKRRNDYSLIV